MEIRIKVGDVEFEYIEETNPTDYPKITSRDRYEEHSTKHDALMKAITQIADKVAEIDSKR